MNIQFHLTNACNLRCKHCYQGAYNPETISLENFVMILEKTKSFFESIDDKIYTMAITGGDPMCVPEIDRYILEADKFCKDMVLMTNGLLLTKEWIDKFKKASSFNRVQVSLEGPENINDAIRGKGTYKKVCDAIRLLAEENVRSIVSCTLAPYNYDKIEELYEDLLQNTPSNVLWFDRCIPFKGTELLTKEQFYVFIESLRRIRQRWKKEHLPIQPLINRAMEWTAVDTPAEYYSCGAGIRHFTVMHNGDVMLCRRLDFSMGNLIKEEWGDIIERAMPTLEAMHTTPRECMQCKFASQCNGGLKCLTYAVYKNFRKKDINCFVGDSDER